MKDERENGTLLAKKFNQRIYSFYPVYCEINIRYKQLIYSRSRQDGATLNLHYQMPSYLLSNTTYNNTTRYLFTTYTKLIYIVNQRNILTL